MADPLAGFRALTNPDQDTVEKMAKLILDDDLSIVWGLFLSGTPKDLESIASILLKFFEQHGRELYLMRQAITKEVQLTSSSPTLFRQNNFASKLLSCYAKRFGLTYINTVLNDVIVNVCLNHQDNNDWSCEIDDRKLPDGKKNLLERNFEHLRSTTAQIILKILNSIDAVPVSFRALCVHLKIEASTKFPDEYPRTTFASVGGFMFLRYICPAIVVPHKYGILEIAPGPAILRDLMLISKVIQTVANGVVFGKKEEYLLDLNEFVLEYQPKVLEFLDKLGEPSPAVVELQKKELQQPDSDAVTKLPVPGVEEVVVRKRRRAVTASHAVARRSKSMDCLPLKPAERQGPLVPRTRRGRGNGTRTPPEIISTYKRESSTPEAPQISDSGTSTDKFPFTTDSGVEDKSDVKEENTTDKRDNDGSEHEKAEEAVERKREAEEKPTSLERRVKSPSMPHTSQLDKKTNFDDHTFSYGELMGIIQYLTVYWQKMKPHLIKMDNNLGTKHTENYIQLSVLLEKLGVTSQEVVEKFSEINENKKKKTSGRGFNLGGMFSKMRSPRPSK